MRRTSALAALAALFLSGCHHWVGWPANGLRFPDGPTRTANPSAEPVYTPDSDSETRTASDEPR